MTFIERRLCSFPLSYAIGLPYSLNSITTSESRLHQDWYVGIRLERGLNPGKIRRGEVELTGGVIGTMLFCVL